MPAMAHVCVHFGDVTSEQRAIFVQISFWQKRK